LSLEGSIHYIAFSDPACFRSYPYDSPRTNEKSLIFVIAVNRTPDEGQLIINERMRRGRMARREKTVNLITRAAEAHVCISDLAYTERGSFGEPS
jgi:hypothetical protein